MSYFKTLLIYLLLTGIFPTTTFPDASPQSITQLEQRLESIDTQLEHLSNYSLRTGFGSVGYASKTTYNSPKATEWIQIELAEPTPIDQIVLVPSIGRNSTGGFHENAFPLEFKIFAGTDTEPNGVVIATFDEDDHVLPRIAPLVVPCSITASWVRVEASLLSRRIYDENYDLKFSEIMVFSGSENMALRRPVSTYTQIKNGYKTQQPRFLTDGFLPYLMDSRRGPASLHTLSDRLGKNPWMSIDLGDSYPLNRIHLHSVAPSHTAPLDNQADYYIPRKMRIEGAQKSDFSDARTLIDVQYKSLLDVGPILMHPFPETACRYVRLTHIDPYIDNMYPSSSSRIGFAEIELFSKGKNRAVGKPITANFKARARGFGFEALTDGLNFYGEILPVREWINELALRHDLEAERPFVVAELNRLYARQKANLKWMRWLAIVAIVGIGVTILIDRMIRLRTIIKLRERIAANLHDELSANLHAVTLLGQLAKKDIDSRKNLEETLDQIEILSKRSRVAARHCTNMLQADTACKDLEVEMMRSSNRMLIDTQHELTVEGDEFIKQLSDRRRNDLFLFYKECLINIARHSNATTCKTELTGTAKRVMLSVTDNGTGMTEVPHSLKRRARLLRGNVTIETPEHGGTSILLTLQRKWRPQLSLQSKGLSSKRPTP